MADLHGDIPIRRPPGDQRPIMPVVLPSTIGSLPVTAREVFPACPPLMRRLAGLASLESTLPCRSSAVDSLLTDSMKQRPNWSAHPASAPLRIPVTTNLPHVALACHGLGVYLRRGYKEISHNATAVNYYFYARGPPRPAQ